MVSCKALGASVILSLGVSVVGCAGSAEHATPETPVAESHAQPKREHIAVVQAAQREQAIADEGPVDPSSCVESSDLLLDNAGGAAAASGGGGKGLSTAQIKRIIEQKYQSFGECYARGLDKDPALAGNLQIGFAIGLDGKVQYAGLAHNTLPDCEVTECVLRAFRTLTFPKPKDDTVKALYPLRLSTR